MSWGKGQGLEEVYSEGDHKVNSNEKVKETGERYGQRETDRQTDGDKEIMRKRERETR